MYVLVSLGRMKRNKMHMPLSYVLTVQDKQEREEKIALSQLAQKVHKTTCFVHGFAKTTKTRHDRHLMQCYFLKQDTKRKAKTKMISPPCVSLGQDTRKRERKNY